MSSLVVLAASLCGWVFSAHLPSDMTDDKKDTYVEFDFSMLPKAGEGKYKLQITIRTNDKGISFEEPLENARRIEPKQFCAFLIIFLNNNKWEAEVVNETKIRVYGYKFNDKFTPTTNGNVESIDLLKDELPKVKFVGKKG